MILSEQEKNRIRGIHKNHSTIKEQQSGSITHDELMDGIDKMCIDRPWDTEKMVGNRSCSRCHSDLTDLIKGYCGSFPSEEETYLDDPGQAGVPSTEYQIANRGR